MNRTKTALIIGTLLSVLVLGMSEASAHKFANQPASDTDANGAPITVPGPLDRVKAAADAFGNPAARPCPTLTTNRLVALMLPPTWAEVVGNTANTPHPMVLGRADSHFFSNGKMAQDGKNQRLYKDSDLNNHGRVFWHPGVGMWQYDDSGLGSNFGIQKWGPYDAVAEYMAKRWCSKNITLANIWSRWFACRGDRCRTTYNEIYDEATDSLRHLDHEIDNMVDYRGGISQRTCRFFNDPTDYYCHYIDAEGAADRDAYTGSWFGSVNGGAGGASPSPLARPFYVVTVESGTNRYELRVWLDEDLPDFAADITATRTYGEDSRGVPNDPNSSGLLWGGQTSMCDVTANRGNC